ncbi:hypothetical protein [Saccharopolyspora pogona]|uniref:hypothetical protein n=1 Tax=Saccharopolyspora pogona TaxID=333966 RepID=UPI001685AC0F|nr:hypothetical protein [Saccharopolyspora pogona]
MGTNPHELSSVLDGHLGSVGAVLGSDAETAGRVTVDGVTVSNEVRGQGWSQRKFADNVKEIAD